MARGACSSDHLRRTGLLSRLARLHVCLAQLALGLPWGLCMVFAGPTISHSIYDKCDRVLPVTEQVCRCMQVQQLRSQVAEQAQMLQQLQQGQALGTNTLQNGPLSAHGAGSHPLGTHASQGHGEGTVGPCRRGAGMAYSVLMVQHDCGHQCATSSATT